MNEMNQWDMFSNQVHENVDIGVRLKSMKSLKNIVFARDREKLIKLLIYEQEGIEDIDDDRKEEKFY